MRRNTAPTDPTPIGIIGAGHILPAYLKTLTACRALRIVGLTSGRGEAERVRPQAEAAGVPAVSLDALLAGPAQIVLNLTAPVAHHAIGLAVLGAGKHLYTEKPLAATLAQGQDLVHTAQARGLRIGSAPDTFLGAASQAVRALVDAGTVGPIHAGSAHFMNHGPDHWHPNPGVFYQAGAGPMHDMGVYYLTHLVNHLGPVASLTAQARLTWRERLVPQGPNAGKVLRVEVPTTVVTQLRFASGAEVSLSASFDVWRHSHPPIELYGEHGSIAAADPNGFGGKVRWAAPHGDWQTVAGRRPYASNARGIGLLDLALALREGRAHRCNEALALHVLEVMDRSLEAADSGQRVQLSTTCERPDALDGRLR